MKKINFQKKKKNRQKQKKIVVFFSVSLVRYEYFLQPLISSERYRKNVGSGTLINSSNFEFCGNKLEPEYDLNKPGQ